jgi:hypothetical protein
VRGVSFADLGTSNGTANETLFETFLKHSGFEGAISKSGPREEFGIPEQTFHISRTIPRTLRIALLGSVWNAGFLGLLWIAEISRFPGQTRLESIEKWYRPY